MTGHELLVIGDCAADLTLRGDVVPSFGQVEQIVDDASLTLGGSAAIVAAGAGRLGVRTGLASAVGDDAFGRLVLDVLRARSVDVDGVRVEPGVTTGHTIHLSTGTDRAMLTALGAIESMRGELVDLALLRGARHVHVTSYFLQAQLRRDLPGVLAAARAAGTTVSLDTNWDPAGSWDDGLMDLLPLVDCFLPNATEARSIAAQDDIDAAAASLADRVATVVVKLGADGALAVSGNARVRCPALAVETIDTTGAGDSFVAGFLAGTLKGWALERSLALGVACGTLSTRSTGVDGQPTLDEALGVIV
jgi:sugar/nucleoside kinase (ribokinase family)